ncbi:NRDE family protein [Desulfatibacillum aliphaticivorans]|uniref:NRDE family protein n=1 Tax=Desulfatibacillum aliphaticivorans TaxID=218208 RepID=UPI0004074B33|nr:NRDE family protein [Desulfatibacillum aliphaticivorans]
MGETELKKTEHHLLCILLWAYRKHPDYPLILAANRDEFFNRPTASMARWDDFPHILAGRDLQGGGTWMGVNDRGRFAALTNVRDISRIKQEAKSRGLLVSGFLQNQDAPKDYLTTVQKKADQYNPFNLVAGDLGGLCCLTGVDNKVRKLDEGVFGLSNWGLDTPWPKVEKGKKALASIVEDALESGRLDREALFSMLADSKTAPDDKLPDTGVGLDWERVLSSIFVKSPGYGTRCSTVLTVSFSGRVEVEERTFGPDGVNGACSVARHQFELADR